MSGKSLLASIVVIGALFAACNNDDEDTTASTNAAAAPTTTQAPATSASSSYRTATPAAATPTVTGERVTVSRIIDGDTFELTDGRTIRVLGIDSCEIGTVEGDFAKSSAESDLTSTTYPVTLTEEPGVDTDQYGRHLRYVQSGYDREDFGLEMVRWDHTGVYQGRNDASPGYVAQLYANDLKYASNPPSGRECGGSSAPASSGSDVDVYVDTDDSGDYNMPDGALTGGYCARKWWC